MSDADTSDGSPQLVVVADWPHPTVCLVRPTGVIDSVTVPRLARHLREQTAAGPRDLVLDLAGVRFLAAAGVALIVAARLGRRGIHGRLHLTGVTGNRPVERVLELTGVRALLDVHDEIGTLLARLAAE
jgi:anti-sigma B factor antagonist